MVNRTAKRIHSTGKAKKQSQQQNVSGTVSSVSKLQANDKVQSDSDLLIAATARAGGAVAQQKPLLK